jgi:quercetin dioxygenase-like cupin family protein
MPSDGTHLLDLASTRQHCCSTSAKPGTTASSGPDRRPPVIACSRPTALSVYDGARMTEQSNSIRRESTAPPFILREAISIRRDDAQRFLWGDPESGQVADLIYGRGERISAVTFALGPGHWFGASEAWKPLYDQHRFYYVVQGILAVHDPETGEVAVAGPGEAVTWRGARYHFGYNVGEDELLVLDWFAPPERPPDAPENQMKGAKRELQAVKGGRYELVGDWPDKRPSEVERTTSDGGMVTVRKREALHFVHGSKPPTLVSILSSSENLTAGEFTLPQSTKTEPEQHPGDEVVYSVAGQLHVHLPETGHWFELNELDMAFIPQGTFHEYWSYGAQGTIAVFCVAPSYR